MEKVHDGYQEWVQQILHELGEPVVTVELDKDQVHSIIKSAKRWAESDDRTIHEMYRYACAMAKQTLGYVRSKYKCHPDAFLWNPPANHQMLLDHAREEFDALGAGPRG